MAHPPDRRARRLFQLWIFRQQSRRLAKILGPAALRAPAAIIDAVRERGIERDAVDAGLSAGEEDHRQILIGKGVDMGGPHEPTG